MSSDVHGIDPNCPGCQELLGKLSEALSEIKRLRRQLAEHEARLEELERAAHRQAAPFRRPEKKRKPKASHKKPGRKPGHDGAYRREPSVIDESVEVPLDSCPRCGRSVEDLRPLVQIIEDIPRQVVVRLRLTTYTGRCEHCGPVRSEHPEQVSTATGAAGTHLGRRALGLAATLDKGLGLTIRKSCAVLGHLGLRITPGGLSQALERIAGKLERPYAQLHHAVRTSPAIHVDETSWWVDGQSRWLWVFTRPDATLYTIDNRSSAVVERILGDKYRGVLISDCLASYDPHPGRKSKCLAHHLKAISEAQTQAPNSQFLRDIRALLRGAIAIHRERDEMTEARFARYRANLERNLTALLQAPHGHPAETRIVNRLQKHRPHLLTFLHVPGVDPTNNLAERQLRPAVIARKLSCGNKTDRGKHTFEILTSLAATCHQRGISFLDFVADAMPIIRPPPALPPPSTD